MQQRLLKGISEKRLWAMRYVCDWIHIIAQKSHYLPVITMLATSKIVLFPGHYLVNHLLATNTDDPTL